MSTLPRVPNIPTVLSQRDGDAAVRSILEYLGRLVIQLEPLVRLAPLAAGEIAQGTPGAGKYPDGGTSPATWTALPAQKRVLQYVSGTSAGGSTSSTTFVDVAGATLSITPASTSNKVLALFAAAMNFTAGGGGEVANIVLNAAGSDVTNTTRATVLAAGGTQLSPAWTYLDSPASVSSVTYKLRQRVNAGTAAIETSNITMALLELEG